MIINNEDGSVSFEYELTLQPCPRCGGTSITLFENGGRKRTIGGARCNTVGCSFEISEEDVPGVPSMDMLLVIWNKYVVEFREMVYKQRKEEQNLQARGII